MAVAGEGAADGADDEQCGCEGEKLGTWHVGSLLLVEGDRDLACVLRRGDGEGPSAVDVGAGAAGDREGEVRCLGDEAGDFDRSAVENDGAFGLGQAAVVVDAYGCEVEETCCLSVRGEGLGEREQVADVGAVGALGAEVVEGEVARLVVGGEDERPLAGGAGERDGTAIAAARSVSARTILSFMGGLLWSVWVMSFDARRARCGCRRPREGLGSIWGSICSGSSSICGGRGRLSGGLASRRAARFGFQETPT